MGGTTAILGDFTARRSVFPNFPGVLGIFGQCDVGCMTNDGIHVFLSLVFMVASGEKKKLSPMDCLASSVEVSKGLKVHLNTEIDVDVDI